MPSSLPWNCGSLRTLSMNEQVTVIGMPTINSFHCLQWHGLPGLLQVRKEKSRFRIQIHIYFSEFRFALAPDTWDLEPSVPPPDDSSLLPVLQLIMRSAPLNAPRHARHQEIYQHHPGNQKAKLPVARPVATKARNLFGEQFPRYGRADAPFINPQQENRKQDSSDEQSLPG